MDKLLLILIFSISIFSFTTNATVIPANRSPVHFPKEAHDRILSAIKECIGNEAKVAEIIKVVTAGKVQEDDEFKGFVHCSFTKSGYALEDGRVNIETSKRLYPDPALIEKIMKRCDEERGETPVENTFKFFKCLQERSPYSIGWSMS